jgi:hypothetical protein
MLNPVFHIEDRGFVFILAIKIIDEKSKGITSKTKPLTRTSSPDASVPLIISNRVSTISNDLFLGKAGLILD